MEAKAKPVCNTGTHRPHDIVTKETAYRILTGSGLTKAKAEQAFLNSEELGKKIKNRC